MAARAVAGGGVVGVPEEGAGEVLLMRHGERVDRVFGAGWAKRAVDGEDYRPYDLNLPLWLGRRAGSWRNDGPLTEVGMGVGRAMGRALALGGPAANLPAVYVSPALRCVQTATSVLAQIPEGPKLRVEPGLFECVGWYDSLPALLSLEELEAAGHAVQTDHVPVMTLGQLEALGGETNLAYAERTQRVLCQLLGGWKRAEAVLVVAHAPTLAVGARLLCGEEREKAGERKELHKAGHHFPFSALLSFLRPTPKPFYSLNPTLLYNLTAANNASAPDIAYLTRKA